MLGTLEHKISRLVHMTNREITMQRQAYWIELTKKDTKAGMLGNRFRPMNLSRNTVHEG